MTGVKGAGGPPPKRDGHRRRANEPAKGAAEQVATQVEVVRPVPAGDWHHAARRWYDSLGESGQHVFYTSADWATAWSAAELLSRELDPKPLVVGAGKDAELQMVRQPFNAAAYQGFLKACTALLATEGDRRRARLELEREGPAESEEAAGVSNLDAWRSRTDGTG